MNTEVVSKAVNELIKVAARLELSGKQYKVAYEAFESSLDLARADEAESLSDRVKVIVSLLDASLESHMLQEH